MEAEVRTRIVPLPGSGRVAEWQSRQKLSESNRERAPVSSSPKPNNPRVLLPFHERWLRLDLAIWDSRSQGVEKEPPWLFPVDQLFLALPGLIRGDQAIYRTRAVVILPRNPQSNPHGHPRLFAHQFGRCPSPLFDNMNAEDLRTQSEPNVLTNHPAFHIQSAPTRDP